MKKVLSFVLVLTLVLGSFSMVFAASDTRSGSQLTDIADSANADAIIANCDLGIITGYTDGSFKPEQNSQQCLQECWAFQTQLLQAMQRLLSQI